MGALTSFQHVVSFGFGDDGLYVLSSGAAKSVSSACDLGELLELYSR